MGRIAEVLLRKDSEIEFLEKKIDEGLRGQNQSLSHQESTIAESVKLLTSYESRLAAFQRQINEVLPTNHQLRARL